MKCVFPYERDIPADMLYGLPVVQNNWLDNGEIKAWDGPFREVHSPLFMRHGSGLAKRTIGQVPSMNETTSMDVLHHARNAFAEGKGEWPSMPAEERMERLEAFLSRMGDLRENVVRLLQWEIGKHCKDSAQEFDRTVNYIRDIFASLKEIHESSNALIIDNGVTGRTMRVPSGVSLVMGPFNYPFFETITALVPALLAGNTVILKPPRLGCLAFQQMMGLFKELFPPGTVNIIYGEGKNVIPPILSSGMVDVLYFIGTSPVATYLRGLHPKPHRLRCILGLEAKNPAIVMPDADLDVTIDECVRGALTFNGQRCAALKVFFVHRSIVGEFNDRLSCAISEIQCGMPWERDAFITPLAEPDRTGYLTGLIENAVGLGAGVVNEGGGGTCGSFFYPAVLYPVTDEMRAYQEEQFGPVIPIVPYDDPNEPIQYISESNYGQQASIFSRDRAMLSTLTRQLVHHVSRVNINCQCQRSPDSAPFTGRKDSAEGNLSIGEAINAFTVPVFIATKKENNDVDIIDEIIK